MHYTQYIELGIEELNHTYQQIGSSAKVIVYYLINLLDTNKRTEMNGMNE